MHTVLLFFYVLPLPRTYYITYVHVGVGRAFWKHLYTYVLHCLCHLPSTSLMGNKTNTLHDENIVVITNIDNEKSKFVR